MKAVYKYRSGDAATFERDLKSIERNCFWASSIDQLNDPTEAIILSDKFRRLTQSFATIFGKKIQPSLDKVNEALEEVISRRNEIGIYSLSQSYVDELLWAHYANSHKGFCIEYDLSKLVRANKTDRNYDFAVSYTKSPPQIDLNDLSDKKGNAIIQKLAGFKSLRWAYEQEHRLIIDKSGECSYNHEALTGIYFGLRMPDDLKNTIMNRLKGRGINYYQMGHVKDSYLLSKEFVADPNGNEITYLNQLPKSSKRDAPVKFRISEKDFNKFLNKAEVTIQLHDKVSADDIQEICASIREQLYQTAERIFIFYSISNQKDNGVPWATSHFSNGMFTISINEIES